MNRIQLSNLAIAMSMGAALVACGGGGGSDNPSGGTTGTPTGGTSSGSSSTTPTSGTLLTTSPTPTYAAGSDQLSAYNTLQTARLRAGAGAFTQNAQLDTAALAHAAYLGDNYSQHGISHTEDPSLPGYYADTLDARLAKSGYSDSFDAEVVAGVNSSALASGGDCVAQLLNTAYHLAAILRPLTQVGIGTEATMASGMPLQLCVVDFATPSANPAFQMPPSGAVVAYPYPGQTNVPASWQPGGETPRVPVALVPNLIAGTPIAISIYNADYADTVSGLAPTLTSFSLKDAAGNLVPAAIIGDTYLQAGPNVSMTSDSTGVLDRGQALLLPLAALNVSATYTVTMSAKLQAGGTPLTKTWSFTTAAN